MAGAVPLPRIREWRCLMRAMPLLFSLSLVLAAPAGAAEAETAVRVVVDPRVELMTAVQLLTDYPVLTRHDSPYRRDVKAYFSRFQDHPVVGMFHGMSQQGFAFDAVPFAVLAFTDPPELKPRVAVPEHTVERAGGRERLDQFMAELRSFAKRSDFPSFFAAHRGTYEQVIENARPAAEKAVAALARYSGMDLKGGTIVLGPLLHGGGFAAFYDQPDGTVEAIALMGPSGVENGFHVYGSAAQLASLTTHEFSHTFVNPLTERHWEELEKHAGLYEPIAEKMKAQAYPLWKHAVNEHLVRAVTLRLAYLEGGQEVGDQELQRQKDRGFQYVEALAERLKEYEAARDRYPTIGDFYPRLVAVFQEAAGREGIDHQGSLK